LNAPRRAELANNPIGTTDNSRIGELVVVVDHPSDPGQLLTAGQDSHQS